MKKLVFDVQRFAKLDPTIGGAGQVVNITGGGAVKNTVSGTGSDESDAAAFVNADDKVVTFQNFGAYVSYVGGSAVDNITNTTERKTIKTESHVTMVGGNGKDKITNINGAYAVIYGDNVDSTEDGEASVTADNITNSGEHATIYGGAGDDIINLNYTTERVYGMTQGHYGNYSSVDGGSGNDKISMIAGTHDVTVNGGAGNNQIYLNNGENNVVIINAEDGGNNVINGLNDSTTIVLKNATVKSNAVNGSDFILTLGAKDSDEETSMTLKGAAGSELKLNVDGQASVMSATQEAYKWTKAVDSDGNSYAAYGNAAGTIVTVTGLNISEDIEAGESLDTYLRMDGQNVVVSAALLAADDKATVSASGKVNNKGVTLALGSDVVKYGAVTKGWKLSKKAHTAVYHAANTQNGYSLKNGKIIYTGADNTVSITLTGLSSDMKESDFSYENGTVTIAENALVTAEKALSTVNVELTSDRDYGTIALADDVNQNMDVVSAGGVYVFNGTAYYYAAAGNRPMAHTLGDEDDGRITSVTRYAAKGTPTAIIENLGNEYDPENGEKGKGYINPKGTHDNGGVYFDGARIIVSGDALKDSGTTIVETSGTINISVPGDKVASTIKTGWDTSASASGTLSYYDTRISDGWTVGLNSSKKKALIPTKASGQEPWVVIEGLKPKVAASAVTFDTKKNMITVTKNAVDLTKGTDTSVVMTTGADTYTLTIGGGLTAAKFVEGGVVIKGNTATYSSESITAGYYLETLASGDVGIKWVDNYFSGAVNIVGVKGGAKAVAAIKVDETAGNIEIGADALGTTNVTVDSSDYSLSLADNVVESTLTAAHWSLHGGKAIYLSDSTTAGFSVADDAHSLIYSKAAKATNLAEVTGMNGTNTKATDLVTNGNVITITKNTTANTSVSVKAANSYSFVLGSAGTMTNAGAAVSLIGSSAADKITGSKAANDTISGGAGNDTLLGLAGNDYIDGGAGNDSIFGGDGNDTLFASDGLNTIDGGAGNDLMTGGKGIDYMDGGAGNDTIRGGAGNDKLYGGDGNDYIQGGDGNDVIQGDKGNDTVYGGAGDDSINGIAGSNCLYGGAGKDILIGGDAANTIDGGTENDKITGGKSNDLLSGGAGDDTIDGGAGNDSLYGGDGNDSLSGGAGNDLIWGGAGESKGNKNVLLGGDGNDTLIAWGGTNTLTGGNGNDVFVCSVLDATEAIVTDFTATDKVAVDYAAAIKSVELKPIGKSTTNYNFVMNLKDSIDGSTSSTLTINDITDDTTINVTDSNGRAISLTYTDDNNKKVAVKTARQWVTYFEKTLSNSSVADLWFDDEDNFATAANIGDIVKSESPFIGEVESSGGLYDKLKKSQDEITVLANADK